MNQNEKNYKSFQDYCAGLKKIFFVRAIEFWDLKYFLEDKWSQNYYSVYEYIIMLFSGLSKSSMLFNNFEVLQIIERLHSC